MTSKKEKLELLIDRYQNGQCTPEEQELLWTWLWRLDIYDQQAFTDHKSERIVRVKMYEEIFRQIDTDNKKRPERPVIGWISRVAAIILLVFITGALLYMLKKTSSSSTTYTLVANDGRQIKKVLLPDSTSVTLNLYSSLSWSDDYNQKDRRVILTGEAFFDVHKDPLHPFIVKTGNLETRALGTAFNIESYTADSEIRVSLIRGRVRVEDRMDTAQYTILNPGQMTRYCKKDHVQYLSAIPVNNITAWTTGSLVFNNIPLSEALDRLGKRYQLQMKYSQKQLEGKMITAVFEDISWKNALKNMLYLNDLHYRLIGDSTVIIR
jgi:ferric-dicitrate binding protein FerR (iron transport regulator)